MPTNDAVSTTGFFGGLAKRIQGQQPLFQIENEFKRISEEGIFSEEDMQQLRQRMVQLSNFRRKQASRGLRRNLRLGPRSGAAEGFIQNRVAGPEFLAEAGREEQLFGANVQSRFAGLQGRFDIERYKEQLRRQKKQDEAGGGILGFAKSLAPIALGFLGGGPAGAAVGAGAGRSGGFQRGQSFGQNANFSPYYNN